MPADRATALAVEISVVVNPAATFAIGLLIPVMILAGADDIIK
jgi:hypothetical protein